MKILYILDLRQFNNDEDGEITFVTFSQAVAYGIYKLREAIKANKNVTEAISIKDPHGRSIVVFPLDKEIGKSPEDHMDKTKVKKIEIQRDEQGDGSFFL
jgi:chlorite dismutase